MTEDKKATITHGPDHLIEVSYTGDGTDEVWVSLWLREHEGAPWVPFTLDLGQAAGLAAALASAVALVVPEIDPQTRESRQMKRAAATGTAGSKGRPPA